jgi:hypothetical protein
MRPISLRRSARFVLLAITATTLACFAAAPSLHGDEPLPLVSASDPQRVFVSGTPDTFERVREAVAKAKKESGRDYRVVVVGDASGTRTTAKKILEAVVDKWQRESAEGMKGGFDPARDVTIVLDVQGRTIAMRAPWGLEVSSGLDPATIEEELIKKVFVPRAADKQYDEGLADLVDATEGWVKTRQDLKKAREDAARVFRKRTLPLGLLGAGALGGLATLLWARSQHDRRMQEARGKLEAFKREVVALSDLLDGQQERHRMLPHTDPDFKTPMVGATRSTYDNVQTSIRRYRERWLSLMDVWEKAQDRINSEWFLGTAGADEAIALLDSADARPPLDDVSGECRSPLDVLEQAHEKAREIAGELDSTLATAGSRLEKIAARGRSNASFQPAIADVTRSLALARHDLESDPVESRGRLEQARKALDETLSRVDAFEAADDRRIKAAHSADEAEKKIQAKRAEGWLLSEPGADPQARIGAAREQVQLAMQLLDAGEIEGGLKHVELAERNVAEAIAILESIVAAKARIDELLPGCVSRLDALSSRREQVVRGFDALAESYAESSWSDLADNIAKSDEGIHRIKAMIAEAQASAEPSRQHYFRALALLEEAVRQEDWVEGCQSAVLDRRAELDGLQATLPKRCATVAGKISELEQRLERQRTDRVRANEHAREAGRLVEVAERGLRVERPDLLQSGRVLDAADTAAARAEDLATEDERLARQAFEEIEETDSVVRRAAAWYAEGVSADVRAAIASLEQSKQLLTRQRYEDSIKASTDAARLAREAYAVAAAEAERRRNRRLQEIQRRQMEESFTRMSRGAGPWVISLPGGVFTGPDPWRTSGGMGRSTGSSHRSAGGSWSNDSAQVGW